METTIFTLCSLSMLLHIVTFALLLMHLSSNPPAPTSNPFSRITGKKREKLKPRVMDDQRAWAQEQEELRKQTPLL